MRPVLTLDTYNLAFSGRAPWGEEDKTPGVQQVVFPRRGPWGHNPHKGTRKLWPDRAQSLEKEGATERACRSPTFFREDKAKRSTVFKVRRCSDISSIGSIGLQELQYCTNRAVNWFQLVISTTWSEESPLQGIQFPHWRSSRLENDLNNLGWETRGYGLCPLRVHTHSFHNSGRGWRIIPSTYERRSLLTGISHGESSRKEIRSENHTRPGQNRATSNSRTPSQRTLSRTSGSRAIGGKAYRRSLGHVCTIASSPSGAGWVRENQRGQCDVWRVANRSTCSWPKTLQTCFTTSGEASIPQASAPASTGCLLLYWDAQEYRLRSARGTCPGTIQGSGAPACIRGANADLPGGWYKKPPLCCQCVPANADFLCPEENLSLKTGEKVSRNWPLVCLELLDRCPETEDRMETIKVAAREIPEGVTRLSAPLRFRAERTERSTRGRPPCPGTLAGLAERSPGGAEERPTPCYVVHPLFPSSCCPQQSWAVIVRTASSRTSQTEALPSNLRFFRAPSTSVPLRGSGIAKQTRRCKRGVH